MHELSFQQKNNEESMEITGVHKLESNKPKFSIKHTVPVTTRTEEEKEIENSVLDDNAFELNENDEKKDVFNWKKSDYVKYEDTQYFNESMCNFYVEDSKKDSTTLLANASLDSDPTLHEYITNTGGGKLNFLQLNEEFEKGHIKPFSHTPPIKKFTTPKTKALQSFKLFNDSNLDLSLNKSKGSQKLNIKMNTNDMEKKNNNQTFFMALTPGAKFKNNKDTSETSSDDFSRVEEETFKENPTLNNKQHTLRGHCNMQLENSPNVTNLRIKNINTEEESTPSSTKRGNYNRRRTVRAPEDIVKDVKDSKEKSRRYTVLAEKDIIIDEDTNNTLHLQQKNRRFTVLAPKEMNLDDSSTEIIKESAANKKNNRRQTVLAVHEMTIDESLPKIVSTYKDEKNSSVYIAAGVSLENLEGEKHVEVAAQHLSQLKLKNIDKRMVVIGSEEMQIDNCIKDVDKMSTGNFIKNMHERFNLNQEIQRQDEQNELKCSNFSNKFCISSKRLTITCDQQMELENETKEKEENVNKDDKDNWQKRLTITTHEYMELEGKPISNDENKAVMGNIASTKFNNDKCRKRLTFIDNEKMELEDNQFKKIEDESAKVYTEYSRKRLTFTGIEQMELEKKQAEKEEIITKYNDKDIPKRLTITMAQQMELEEEKDKLTVSKERRIKVTNKQQMDIEKGEEAEVKNVQNIALKNIDKSINFDQDENDSEIPVKLKSNAKDCKKRLTITKAHQMELEEEKEILTKCKAKRMTITSKEEMDIEKEQEAEVKNVQNVASKKIHKSINFDQDERGTEIPVKLKPSNKRFTITANAEMDLEDDNDFMDEAEVKTNKLFNEMNCKLEDEENHHHPAAFGDENIVRKNKNRLTVTTQPQMEIVGEKREIEEAVDIDREKNRRKRITTIHNVHMELEDADNKDQNNCNNRKSLLFPRVMDNEAVMLGDFRPQKNKRDHLDKSIDSSSPASKKCNVEFIDKLVTPNRNRKSQIPILISSTKRQNSSSLQIINLDNSLDTIPIPRRLIRPVDKSVVEILSTSHNLNETKKTVELFEDNPITLSDVSGYSPLRRADTKNADVNVESSIYLPEMEKPRLSLINTTVGNMMNYINLSYTPNSLLENESAVKFVSQDDEAKTANLTVSISNEQNNKQNVSDASIISFPADTFVGVRSPTPLPEIGLKELKRLRQKSSLFDALSRHRRISLDLPWNFNDVTLPSANNTCVEDVEDEWFDNFKKVHDQRIEKYKYKLFKD